jgi:ATP-dependent RNA helicase RhlB
VYNLSNPRIDFFLTNRVLPIMSDVSEFVNPFPRAEKPEFLTKKRFDELDLPAELQSALAEAGFIYCTPIQERTLPISLSGRDVAGQAQTGTGKTAAFLVTVITRLLAFADRDPHLPSALIVAPTRELSHQIYQEACTLCRHTNLKIAEVVGGVDYKQQAEILRRGVDIIICTPGRIIDYFRQGIFKPAGIKILVIDEADRLFDLGFTKDMRFLLRKLPLYEKRQSMLFSATLSYRVLELTYEYMNLPEFISVTPESITVEGIEQQLFHVGSDKKLELLLGLLKREDWNRVLIFVNTKVGVDWLTMKLKGNGWPAEKITGDLPQRKRFRLMEQFKKGQIKILVATDVASRGIHVEDISHVINYDLPQDSENYVHRIGRTARAGKTGKAFALACEEYVYHLEPLEEMLGYKIPVVWPANDWFVADTSKPVVPERRSRLRRSGRQRSKLRATKRTEAQPLSKESKPRRFPGAFFGFGPGPDQSADSKTATDSAARTARKRPRRKKKSTFRGDGKSRPGAPDNQG